MDNYNLTCPEHGGNLRDDPSRSMAYLIPRKEHWKNEIFNSLSYDEIRMMSKGKMPVRCFHYPEKGYCENKFVTWE